MDDDTYFGPPEKIAMMRRAASLWFLLRDDPRFAFYGRLVALGAPTEDTAGMLEALTRLQGASVCYRYPKNDAASLLLALSDAGFATDRHEHFQGGSEARAAAETVITSRRLPDRLRLVRLDSDTTPSLVAETAALCESCDVLAVPDSTLRGTARPGICLVAIDRSDTPVATVSAFALYHRDNPHRRDVFWGMAATMPNWRGHGLAQVLGARAIAHMWDHAGARGFMTGVKRDNLASRGFCATLAITDSDFAYIGCIDPAAGIGAVTR